MCKIYTTFFFFAKDQCYITEFYNILSTNWNSAGDTSALVFKLNKLRTATVNTSKSYTLKSDHFYTFVFAFEAKIPKGKWARLKFNQKNYITIYLEFNELNTVGTNRSPYYKELYLVCVLTTQKIK